MTRKPVVLHRALGSVSKVQHVTSCTRPGNEHSYGGKRRGLTWPSHLAHPTELSAVSTVTLTLL